MGLPVEARDRVIHKSSFAERCARDDCTPDAVVVILEEDPHPAVALQKEGVGIEAALGWSDPAKCAQIRRPPGEKGWMTGPHGQAPDLDLRVAKRALECLHREE